MSRLLNILLGFALLLSLAMGVAAHAAETRCMQSLEAALEGHDDGDADQAPHGQGGAHHHGDCHGHHNIAPCSEAAANIVVSRPARAVAFEASLGTPAPPGNSLRPPIA